PRRGGAPLPLPTASACILGDRGACLKIRCVYRLLFLLDLPSTSRFFRILASNSCASPCPRHRTALHAHRRPPPYLLCRASVGAA
ncbi:hypothetical protein B0H14DRAFT_3880360, partial [Mycena olivaceomarginata]